jgi:methionyl-tRNA synthetase
MATVLHVTAEVLREIGILVQPYMPGAAAKLLDLLAVPAGRRMFAHIGDRLVAGVPLPAPQPIFPRYLEEGETPKA